MSTILTHDHFAKLERDSCAIIHNFLSEIERSEIAVAIRHILPPWSDLEDKTTTSDATYFPYKEQCINRAILNRECIHFAQKWLGTKKNTTGLVWL